MRSGQFHVSPDHLRGIGWTINQRAIGMPIENSSRLAVIPRVSNTGFHKVLTNSAA
jgi:hypothetical protein